MIWALAADTEPVVRLTPQARIIGAVLAIAFMALIGYPAFARILFS